ncbi:MAG: NAD(P)-binding domain-containing protein [Actinomycetota bacterium]|nr:NAD(P)-binding domain-containing protein [Actinomycetota bacterium]MDQ3647071.1 NAD(P)-binding domain-containing protein [Actinomycetota bacterium]
MRFGVLGTGVVGRTIATKLVGLGHEVWMGSRVAGNESASAWAAESGDAASEGDFAAAAGFGEVVVNATAGTASLEVLRAVGAEVLAGKVLIDVANALDFSRGMPPVLAFCNDDSLGERIQREFAEARVVKTLNTVNAEVMVDPALAGGETDVFVCGDDEEAKAQVTGLLGDFGWGSVVDLGDITAARGAEMYLPLWLRLFGAKGTGHLNVKVVSAA